MRCDAYSPPTYLRHVLYIYVYGGRGLHDIYLRGLLPPKSYDAIRVMSPVLRILLLLLLLVPKMDTGFDCGMNSKDLRVKVYLSSADERRRERRKNGGGKSVPRNNNQQQQTNNLTTFHGRRR